MDQPDSVNAVPDDNVIKEETVGDEISQNGIDEDSRVEEIKSEDTETDKEREPSKTETSKVGKMKGKKKSKIVKLIPKEHACQPVRLPIVEVVLYVVGWTAAALYSLYAVLRLSTASGDRLHKDTMGPGCSLIGRPKDISNFEWTFWSSWFLRAWPWFFLHIAIGQLLRKWNNKHRKYVYLGYHAVAVFCILGIQPSLLVVANCVMAYMAAWCGSVIMVWAVSIALVAFLNYDPYTAGGDFGFHPLKVMTDFNEDVFYLLVFSIAMTNLRYTSFALDWISKQKRDKAEAKSVKLKQETLGATSTESKEKLEALNDKTSKPDKIPIIKEPANTENNSSDEPPAKDDEEVDPDGDVGGDVKIGENCQESNRPLQESDPDALRDNEPSKGADELDVKYSLVDMLSYCLYLPYYFTGPIATYDEFYKQFHAPMREWSRKDMRDIFTSTLRVVFWTVFIEVVLHYFYFNSIMLHLRLMWHIPLWALAGIGYGAGQFFMVKYVVLFGLPGMVGKLDQLQPPEPPRCIAYIYKYSEMWKYFDRGLYSFLKRHIYIPLGGSRKGVGRQLIASAVCFAFIFWWHGGEWNLFYWSLVNFVGICLETGGKLFAEIPRVANWEAFWLSPGMGRRIRALFGIPLLMMNTLAIFTFFGGNSVGYIFIYRLLYEGAPLSVLTICAAFYCFCQTSMEVQRWRRRKAEGIAENKEKLKTQ